MIKNLHTCQYCPFLEVCILHHKVLPNERLMFQSVTTKATDPVQASEAGTAETSGLGPLFEEKVRHLNQTELDYYATWEKLIQYLILLSLLSLSSLSLSLYSNNYIVRVDDDQVRGR